MTILIAITGGSGSGKSTLAEALVSSLPDGVATLLREDSYYLDAASVPDFDAATHDFDDVAARDHNLLIADLAALKDGRTITAPVYSFIHHGREAQGEPVSATDVIVARAPTCSARPLWRRCSTSRCSSIRLRTSASSDACCAIRLNAAARRNQSSNSTSAPSGPAMNG